MDIVSGLSAISHALDAASKLKAFEKQFNDAEFKLQIAELYTSLADAKIALANARQTILEKDNEIDRLMEKNAHKMRTVSYRGYNFGIDSEGNSIGRPFCPVCERKDGIQVQIMRGLSNHDLCPSCQGIFSDYPWKLPDDFEIPPEGDAQSS